MEEVHQKGQEIKGTAERENAPPAAAEKPARPRPIPKRQTAAAESGGDGAVPSAPTAPAEPAPHPLLIREQDLKLERRRFLRRLTWGSIFTFLGGWAVAAARFFFPRALFEPPTVFKAGFPSEYTIGRVETKYQQSHRVWIVREADGFYAILAKCTHLGCTPVWIEAENKFKCPCHGSGFTREAINYEGPAPRPLERVKITLAEDGQILIDTSVVFRYERGEWDKPGAYLKV
jgi:cytochrome b6-f complex iron-sulfur subunit